MEAKIQNKYHCVIDIHHKIGGNTYWVGGSDEKCEGSFGWCDADLPFSKWIPWFPPGNIKINEGANCVIFDYCNAIIKSECFSRFTDKSCNDQTQFICEVTEKLFIIIKHFLSYYNLAMPRLVRLS